VNDIFSTERPLRKKHSKNMLAMIFAAPTENAGRTLFENGIFDSQHLLKKL